MSTEAIKTDPLREWVEDGAGRVEGCAKRYGPLGAYISQLFNSASEIMYKFYQTSTMTVSALADMGSKLTFLAVIFVPLRLYNVTQIIRSNDTVKNKALDILIELGGVFSGATIFASLFVKNIKRVAPYLPYVVGISTLFQCVDVYKKALTLHRTNRALHRLVNDEEFDLFYNRLQAKQLTDQDKRVMQFAYKFDTDKIDAFCDSTMNKEKKEVQNLLRGRIDRALISNRVALIASVVETLASILVLVSFFVAPPLGAILSIVNVSLLGTTAATKIALFFYDQITRNLMVKDPPSREGI